MRRVLGYPVLAVGLFLSAQAFTPSEPAPFEPAPPSSEIALLPQAETLAAPARSLRQSNAEIVPPRPVLAHRPQPGVRGGVTPSSASVTVADWRTVVVTSQNPATTDIADRDKLIRSIQRELKRTGCYYGTVDGSWGGASKRALAAFIDRVNATLPITEPDHVLLALVRAQPDSACSAACPHGQSFDYSGRCIPNAVLAHSSRRDIVTRTASVAADPNGEIAWTAEVQPSAADAVTLPAPAPLPGRMSIGGPREFTALSGTTVGEYDAFGAREIPARNGATYTTASLDQADRAFPQDGASLLPQRDILPAAAPAPRAAKASKPTRRSKHTARSVQHLFTHPLGRM